MQRFEDGLDGSTLTDSQRAMATALDTFLAGDTPVFLMQGGAGTGKTFMLGKLVAHLRANRRACRLMAPTGRAAKVLATRTGVPAATIHRSIYRMDDLKEYKVKEQDGSETYKFYFDLAENDESVDTVYIVDEASMVGDTYSEAEFFRFGSGHLLGDLLRYTAVGTISRRHKIIFCGDPAQLPPVGATLSPALSATTLKATYGLDSAGADLRDVVRQSAGSGILRNATPLRHRILAKDFSTFEIKAASDIETVKSAALVPAWLGACERNGMDQTIIVAETNRQVRDFNAMIRQHRYGRRHVPIQPGDRILVVRNNYSQDIPLLNGEFGTVVAAADPVDHVSVFLNKPQHGRRVNEKVELALREVTLRFEDPEAGAVEVDCLINDDLLASPERGPSSDVCKALYVDFKRRHPMLQPGTAAFREAIRTDRRFNCLQIKFGYAVTCHKAQGGEWTHAFVDFSNGQSVFAEAYFRWAYTAMTRACDRLYVMNVPFFSRLTARRPTTDALQMPEDTVLRVPDAQSAATFPFPMPDEAPWVAALYPVIADFAAAHGLRISGLRHRAYAEDYTLADADGGTVITAIYYNRHRKVTRVCIDSRGDDTLARKLAGLPERLEGYRLTGASRPVDDSRALSVIGSGLDYQTAILDALTHALSDQGIALEAVRHVNPFLTTCRFTRNGDQAVINYYFNKHGALTRTVPDMPHATSRSLLESLVDLSRPEATTHA